MTIIDDLAADAHVQHVGVSPAGRAVMARTELDEDKLGQLIRSFPPAERRAFWLGVLLRDGAISVQVALTSRTAPPPRPARRADPPRSWWPGCAEGAGSGSRSGGIVAGHGRYAMSAGRVAADG